MVRKRLDERIRALLERGVATGHRSMLVLVGDHGKDQVPNLHQILSKCTLQTRPKVLWCYKKELGFSTHRKKRMKKLKRDKARGLTSAGDTADNFELFVSSTDITWCYYKDSHRILGTTFGVLVLQDFEALTPNLMARTIETVQGGGLVIFLLRTVSSLQQLYAMTMDVHARFRTEAASDVVPRFNERFILSLASCHNCLVCDDELNVLTLSKRALQQLAPTKTGQQWTKGDAGDVVVPTTPEEQELKDLQESLVDTPHVGALVDLTKTLDQAKAVLVVMDACSADHTTAANKVNNTTIAMTAARGRGKSAAIGLCLAGAVSLGYSTICVTAPEPENLVAVFDFVVRGLQALKYQEHLDYRITYNNASGREQTKCVVAIHIYKTHRQLIQYISPQSTDKFQSAELVAIDEAAAIPLPIVRALMQQPDRITLLSSTINGYEGTGRALSLKLIKELRDKSRGRQAELDAAQAAANSIAGPKSNKGEAKVHEQRWAAAAEAAAAAATSGETLSGPLREVELITPIRYAKGDSVEAWLNQLLCLDCGNNLKLQGGAPAPMDCELYSVDRDALFSYHKLSEAFLQKVMGLYTSAHYKNTPNDLQMLSDAPAHALFVLLSPAAEQQQQQKKRQPGMVLPDVLAVVQIALEGRVSRKAVEAQLARGHRSAGDLIPWTISQQFGDSHFAQLSGARIVRIAVHPSLQGMGYGSRAVELLYRFYNGEIITLANTMDEDGGDEDEKEEEESSDESEADVGGDDDAGKSEATKTGILAEKLTPRKELPPLLLPLTEVDSPRLDWIGTSFGLTNQLHKFWSRAGMRLLYLRQTTNELTGEHSAIMVRALPKRSGVNDTWLPAFVGDTKRRLLALLGGPFRTISVRLAISVLENLDDNMGSSDVEQSGVLSSKRITAEEVNYFLAPHDLKRLDLYGRNLCDHHLITDLLPVCARLYFTSRFGVDFKLSSLQAALLCGLGLQNKTVDDLTAELTLPSNQVLAMFNKTLRKVSVALNAILEEKEKEEMMSGQNRTKAEAAANRMRNVAPRTLEEDADDAAKEVMDKLVPTTRKPQPAIPKEIARDEELRQYVVKGSEEQWDKALKEGVGDAPGNVQIHTVREKRKIDDADLEKESKKHTPTESRGKKSKKMGKQSSKKSRK